MSIRNEVLRAIAASPTCLFPEEIHARMPHAKIATVRATCFDLVEEGGQLKAKKKDRPGQRIACVFYLRDDQIAGVEGLMEYEPRVISPKTKPVTDALLTLPITGDAKVTSITLTIDSARALHQTLCALFSKVN